MNFSSLKLPLIAQPDRSQNWVIVVVFLVIKLCLILYDPMGFQVPLSVGFPKQEYEGGLPFPSPGALSDPE